MTHDPQLNPALTAACTCDQAGNPNPWERHAGCSWVRGVVAAIDAMVRRGPDCGRCPIVLVWHVTGRKTLQCPDRCHRTGGTI